MNDDGYSSKQFAKEGGKDIVVLDRQVESMQRTNEDCYYFLTASCTKVRSNFADRSQRTDRARFRDCSRVQHAPTDTIRWR